MSIADFKHYVDQTVRRSRNLEIEGWAFCSEPILELQTLLDGQSLVCSSTHGLFRKDVGILFPLERHARDSGFRVAVRLPDESPHCVTLQFRCAKALPRREGNPFGSVPLAQPLVILCCCRSRPSRAPLLCIDLAQEICLDYLVYRPHFRPSARPKS